MTETFVGTVPVIGTAILVLGCWFYMWGGRDGKWKRRFIGSLLCSLAIIAETLIFKNFNIFQLLCYPLLIGTFILGYNATTTMKKVIRRSIVVGTSLLVGLIMCLTIGGKAWLILPVQAIVAFCSVWLAVKNPIPASAEEFFVCLLLTECNLMYPFVGQYA